jgi:short-subunit dehydrogenase
VEGDATDAEGNGKRGFKREAAGSIVISSLAGGRGMPPLGAYGATKSAVIGLSEALRVELYGSGIRLSLVMPGVIDTSMVHGASNTQSVAQTETGKDPFKLLPDSMPAMPTQWVTWAAIYKTADPLR